MKAFPVISICLLSVLPVAARLYGAPLHGAGQVAVSAAHSFGSITPLGTMPWLHNPGTAAVAHLADTSLGAHFPGGAAGFAAVLDSNLRYPEKTKMAKTEGDLVFNCTLTASGRLMNYQAFSGVEDKDLIWEAMRLLAIPRGWIPYTSGGQPVDQEVYICLSFSLAGEKPAVKASFNVQPPDFPGGRRSLYTFLGSHLEYPKKGRKYKDGSYTAYVTFVVDETGRLTNVGTKGEKSGYGFEEAAIKAVNAMPRWHPCFVDGRPKPAKFVLPVVFRLE